MPGFSVGIAPWALKFSTTRSIPLRTADKGRLQGTGSLGPSILLVLIRRFCGGHKALRAQPLNEQCGDQHAIEDEPTVR